MRIFFQTQELYYFEIIEKMTDIIREVFNTYLDSYATTTESLFLFFLAFQIITLFYIRAYLINSMKDDVFKSRGILSLIPDNFFEQNRTKVEKLIKNVRE